MDRMLYLDCSRGISGDMTVAALLDLGADENVLRRVLDTVPGDGFGIAVGRVIIEETDCCDFDVQLDREYDNHDHDMDYLFGHNQKQEREAVHFHHKAEGNREPAEEAVHFHHDEEVHRNLAEVIEIIDSAEMTETARKLACEIFSILAEAEAQAHDTTKDEVHFHEVGALDSIADIIAVAVCLDDLDINGCIIRELCEGRGTVRCAHGILDIPVPAVRAVSEQHGLVLREIDAEGEYVTPTGAAVAAAIRTADSLPENYRVIREGFGAGKRKYELPGFLKAMLIEVS